MIIYLDQNQFAGYVGVIHNFIRGKIAHSIALLRRYVKNRKLISLQPAVAELQGI